MHPVQFFSPVLGVNWSISGCKVIVKVSLTSLSNVSPVSPGANERSKCCASFESVIRRLIIAKGLPGQA